VNNLGERNATSELLNSVLDVPKRRRECNGVEVRIYSNEKVFEFMGALVRDYY